MIWSIESIPTQIGLLIFGLVRLGGGFVSLFFGRRLTWLWVALAVYNLVSRVLAVALYREVDSVRLLISVGVGIGAAVLAVFMARRFPRAVFAVGGCLAGGLISIQALGPLLNPFPEWLVIGILVALGIAGGTWAMRNPDIAGIVLSALVGAGLITSALVTVMGLEESARLQVYVLLSLFGIGFQFWRERRASAAAPLNIEGV